HLDLASGRLVPDQVKAFVPDGCRDARGCAPRVEASRNKHVGVDYNPFHLGDFVTPGQGPGDAPGRANPMSHSAEAEHFVSRWCVVGRRCPRAGADVPTRISTLSCEVRLRLRSHRLFAFHPAKPVTWRMRR